MSCDFQACLIWNFRSASAIEPRLDWWTIVSRGSKDCDWWAPAHHLHGVAAHHPGQVLHGPVEHGPGTVRLHQQIFQGCQSWHYKCFCHCSFQVSSERAHKQRMRIEIFLWILLQIWSQSDCGYHWKLQLIWKQNKVSSSDKISVCSLWSLW